jgi:argininosuccinate lyase
VVAGQRTIAERSLEELKTRSGLFEEDLYAALIPRASVETRNLPGGPAPEEVRRQIAEIRKKIGAAS